MPDKGFAIRCPHCQRWNIQENVNLDEAVITSKKELSRILMDLNRANLAGKENTFSHPKLWRCVNPRSLCPSSFEAFICKSEEQALEFLKDIEAWSLKRDFRLYKANCQTRWENKYYGILFNTQFIPRPQHIELELLMDRELVSRLIVGIGVELEAPVTIYSANLFTDPKTKKSYVYWMPIEAYSQGRLLVPTRYNKFCYTCRQIVMEKLTDEFENKNYNVYNCPIGFADNGQCADKDPACMNTPEKRDWNLCPAFIEKRKKWCPCYRSDLRFIQKVEKTLKKRMRGKGEFEEETLRCYRKRCYAGFHERAIPIVVHGYLLGVAMSGQTFFKPQNIVSIARFCEKFKILKGHEKSLERAKRWLINSETQLKSKSKSKFFIPKKELQKRLTLLDESLGRVARTAASRYRGIRGGTEWAFRQEILGLIQNAIMKPDFFQTHILQVMERMRTFWAFEAVYLAQYSPESKRISVIAFSHKYRKPHSFGIPGKHVGPPSDIKYEQVHPCPYLHRKGQQMPSRHNPIVGELLPIFDDVTVDQHLEVPKGDDYFFVVIPFLGKVYAFAFTVRDEQIIGKIEHRVAGGVSRLCQDSILETCTEVIFEFGEEWYRKARERAWREFSAHASHRIGNEISPVSMLLDVLIEQLSKDPNWGPKWADKLPVMQGCIRASKKMLSDLTVLTAQITPRPKLTNFRELLRRAALGVLPEQAKLNLQHLPPDTQLLVDPELMEQAFRELFTNAVRVVDKNLRLIMSARKEKDRLCISLRDNGPGIPNDKAKRIFEPFVAFQPGRSGLGLATVRRIIEAHGGDIHLQPSTVGAHFIISLPLKEIKQK